jgi:hypothetical protein
VDLGRHAWQPEARRAQSSASRPKRSQARRAR